METDEKVSVSDGGEKWDTLGSEKFSPEGQAIIDHYNKANEIALENIRRGRGREIDDVVVDNEEIDNVEEIAERVYDTMSENEQGALVKEICRNVIGEEFSAIRKKSIEEQEEIQRLIQDEIDRREASGEINEWLEERRAATERLDKQGGSNEFGIPKESEERLREIETWKEEKGERESKLDQLERVMNSAEKSYDRFLDGAKTFEEVEATEPERIEQKEASRRIYIGHLTDIVKFGAEGGNIDRSMLQFYMQKAGKDVDEIRKRVDDDPDKQMLSGEINEDTLRKAMKEGGAERKEIEVGMAERGVRVAEAGVAAVKLQREGLNGNADESKLSRIGKKAIAPFRFMKKDELEYELKRADQKLREAERRLEAVNKFYESREWDALSPEEKEAELRKKWEREENERRFRREQERRFAREEVERRRQEKEVMQNVDEVVQTEVEEDGGAEEANGHSDRPRRRRGVPKAGRGLHARRD